MDPNLNRRWPVIIAAGLLGSGSTWAYNALRLLLLEMPEARPLHCGFADCLADLHEPRETPGALLIKTHMPDKGMRLFARATAAPVVLTVRDPRDACVSMMQRFGAGFDAMRQAVVTSADRLLGLTAARPALLLRYEDGFTRDPAAVARIAAFLRLKVAPDRLHAIAESLLPDRVAADIAAMTAAGAFGVSPTPERADPVTQWHPGHVGDGRSGKWRDLLDAEQAASIIKGAAEFARRFGYAERAA